MTEPRRLAAAAAAVLALALAGACNAGEDPSEPSSAPRAESTSTTPAEPTPAEPTPTTDPSSEATSGPTSDPAPEDTTDATPEPFATPSTSGSGTASTPPLAITSPVRRPAAVRNLRVLRQQDGRVLLAWQAPRSGGSPVTAYRMVWPGGGRTVRVASTSAWATGLENGVPVSFAVWAVNAHGAGPRSTVLAEGAGRPGVPVLDAPAVADAAGRTTKHVTVSWSAVVPNGPGPVEYFVEADGRQVCGGAGWTTATVCSDELANDGSVTSYTVRARNAEATSGRSAPAQFTSAASAPRAVEAAAPPEGVRMLRAVATGVDGQARVTFDVGPSHGRENVIHCSPGCGDLAPVAVSASGAAGVSFLIGGLGDGNVSGIAVWTCNGSSGSAQTGPPCSMSATDQVITFGPLGMPTVNAHANGACFNWQVSGDANGKPATLAILAQGFAQSWVITGPATRTGSYCPGFGETRTFIVRIDDSGATAEQPVNRGTRQSSTTALTTPTP